MNRQTNISRRTLLTASAAVVAAGLVPPRAWAQPAPIKLGTLTPLTGAGGSYGPSMRKAMEFVAQEVNGAGGVLGRQIQLVSEDDQTNPEAAVRAARKLIDVDKRRGDHGHLGLGGDHRGGAAVLGEQDVPDHGVGLGYDHAAAAPGLPRSAPSPTPICRSASSASSSSRSRSKRVFVLAAQTPFALPSQKRLTELLPKGGGEVVGAVIYDKDKTTFRSEIDQALRAKPDMIYLNGYTPDCTVLMKELFKAGYTGPRWPRATR